MTFIRTVRDARSSLFQSIVDHVMRARLGTATRPTLSDPHVCAGTVAAEHLAAGMSPPGETPAEVQQLSGGDSAWACVKRAAEIFAARADGQIDRAEALAADFKDSTCDPAWLETIDRYVAYFGLDGHKRAVPYVAAKAMSDYVLEALPPNATVLLIGDWATGTPPAIQLLHEAATHAPDVIVHLGDIYYSGTEHESQANFLDVINQTFDRASGHVPLYTLAGNHDMYSGGAGYYTLLPHLNPSPPFTPAQAQPASFFCLRNASRTFQFLAMDTGLHDDDPFTVNEDVTWLEPDEAKWHLDKIESFHAAGGKTILLSHHQLFTAFEPIGRAETRPPDQQAVNPNLLATFHDVLAAGKVAAWFWGHEHNLGIYEPYGPLARGRCIGHAAVPVFPTQAPYAVSAKITNPPALVQTGGRPVQLQPTSLGVFQHGYVILRLDDAAGRCEASYYVEASPQAPIYQETIE